MRTFKFCLSLFPGHLLHRFLVGIIDSWISLQGFVGVTGWYQTLIRDTVDDGTQIITAKTTNDQGGVGHVGIGMNYYMGIFYLGATLTRYSDLITDLSSLTVGVMF